MTEAKTFAMIGGGIGGLTAAIALQKKRFTVRVYENAPMFHPVGAGIVLAANAIKAFRAIGIENEILAAGKELKQFAIKNSTGAFLNTTEADKIDKEYGSAITLALHRADLHEVLLRNLQPGTVLSAKSCTAFEQRDKSVKLFFADGSSVDEPAVVAADGIHSLFRKTLIPERALRYSGYTCWRAILKNVPEELLQDYATETWGRGRRFGIVPLSNNRIYWYATVDAPAGDPGFASLAISGISELYRDFHLPVQRIIASTKKNDLIKSDIFDFKPVHRYAFGNIVLLGDAAHATTPNLGQGACMAIEDAVVLADCISKQVVPAAFRTFESRRIKRNTRIVNASYSLGKISQIRNPLLAKLRDAAIRMTPKRISEKQLRFLYNISFE